MSIIIASRTKSRELAANEPGKYNIISILEPDMEAPPEVSTHAKAYLPLNFHDIEYARQGYVHPTEQHVEDAIHWARGKDDLVVACRAGISRSSAIAYLIQCEEHHPRLATAILTPLRHHPNSLIVKLGSKLLKNQDILDEYHRWMQESLPRW
jgi:predicted protein tyrosine phosphatase